ncbi:MAG: hypothetical protein WBM50_11325 [Acidimicrobiales bacterium]
MPSTTGSTTTAVPTQTGPTIDFDRLPNQSTSPLPEGATATELAAMVDDMRGPTNDVSEQMIRLAPFVDFDTPPKSQITDLSITVAPTEEGLLRISAGVALRSPLRATALAAHFDIDRDSQAWNRLSQVEETVDRAVEITQVFRNPGYSGDDNEMRVTIIDGPFSVYRVDYLIVTDPAAEADLDEDAVDVLASLLGWQEAIRLPQSATLVEARIRTAEDLGRLEAVYRVPGETAAEVRADIGALIRPAEFETPAPGGSGENAAPLVLIDSDQRRFLVEFATAREPEIIEIVISTEFDLQPIDP